MTKIRVVTDSTADIPEEIRRKLNIEIVPLKVHFGEEAYMDSVTIMSKDFYAKLAVSDVPPTTSQPSPVDFLDVYRKINREEGVQIVSIHLSAALSGTYQSAVLARSMMEEQADITIIDSKSASYGIGVRVIKAAEAAQQGKSKEEILELLDTIDKKFSLYFLVDTLEYLQKGGRIGKASAFLGSLLNIKPILTLDEDGEVDPVDKVRGHKKAVARIIGLLKEKWGPDEPVELGLAHADCLQWAEEISALVREHFNVKTTVYTWVGPVIGTHTGPGTVGVFLTPAL